MDLKEKFVSLYGGGVSDVRLFSAAGRVNLIGEHIDYNGGKVFPAALDLTCVVAARKNGTDKVNVAFTTARERVELDLSKIDSYKNTGYGEYQAAVLCAMKDAGYGVYGCDLLYDTTVPFGSGLSSSAAIEVATAYMTAVFDSEAGGQKGVDPVQLALISQRAENKYVGVSCGIMDQFASACGKKDKAIVLDCATLDYTYVDFNLGGYALVISNTNRPRSLSDSKYNERRAECDEAVALLKKKIPDLQFLCELSVDQFVRNQNLLSGKVRDRAEHAVRENQRVNDSVEAMRRGDIEAFGELLNASHKSLKELYEVSSLELDTLAETAQTLDGCAGARMTGAGFGGCTIALVQKGKVPAFIDRLSKIYTEKTGRVASFYETRISDGAYEVLSDPQID